MQFDAYEALKKTELPEVQRLADQLSDTGFATDEDGLCLGSSLAEHWSGQCTSFLTQLGYGGGPLRCTGQYFPERGAIYVLYDSARHTLEDAREELARAAARSAAA